MHRLTPAVLDSKQVKMSWVNPSFGFGAPCKLTSLSSSSSLSLVTAHKCHTAVVGAGGLCSICVFPESTGCADLVLSLQKKRKRKGKRKHPKSHSSMRQNIWLQSLKLLCVCNFCREKNYKPAATKCLVQDFSFQPCSYYISIRAAGGFCWS